MQGFSRRFSVWSWPAAFSLVKPQFPGKWDTVMLMLIRATSAAAMISFFEGRTDTAALPSENHGLGLTKSPGMLHKVELNRRCLQRLANDEQQYNTFLAAPCFSYIYKLSQTRTRLKTYLQCCPLLRATFPRAYTTVDSGRLTFAATTALVLLLEVCTKPWP